MKINQSDALKRKRRKRIAQVGILLLILAFFVVPPLRAIGKEAIALLSKLDLEQIKAYILSFGIWAPVISFLLMVFQSLVAPLPAFLITFANAGLFGWWKGAILSWSSAMVGAILCFYIARIYGRDTVEKLSSRTALAEVDKFFDRYGEFAILIARLLPFMSFDIVSYAAGLTPIGLWPFIWATGLGQLPATLVYSYVGGMLTGGAQLFVTGLLILFAISIAVFLVRKVMQDRKKDRATSDSEG